jgi:hypothetical protein
MDRSFRKVDPLEPADVTAGNVIRLTRSWDSPVRPRRRPPRRTGKRAAQPLTLAAPVSMCPVTRRDHELSPLTVTVKSYQPLAMVTALK